MLKHVLLAGAVLIAAPALAQTAPKDGQDKPATPNTSTTAPKTATPPAPTTPQPTDPAASTTVTPPADATPPATAAVPATPMPADPAADPAAAAPNAQAAMPAPADPATAATTPAPATPAAATPAPGAQVADVVGKEFPTYDKNKDGKLSMTEFGAWMLALRKASDPAIKDDAANKTWTTTAFGQADADKSKTVSKDELTNFLAQATKAS